MTHNNNNNMSEPEEDGGRVANNSQANLFSLPSNSSISASRLEREWIDKLTG